MVDNLTITRVWQDTDFFQIEIECKSELIVVCGKVYTSDCLIDDLCNKIKKFLSGSVQTACWQNGTKGEETTPCVILNFIRKDKCGHILIEVFMDIDDEKGINSHNCCFCINTETGLLFEFGENLSKLKIRELGTEVSLNY